MTMPAAPASERAAAATLAERYAAVRRWTESLCVPLETEDYVVRTMPDVSPTKWHLAHTSWFFETFVLRPFEPAYVPLDARYAYLFNSYYVQAGERHCRAQRGFVTRPTVAQVYAYRAHVDAAMTALLARTADAPADDARERELRELVTLGLHHEQQHQELIVTDLKHVFWMNPLRPAYHPAAEERASGVTAAGWLSVEEGVHEIGQPDAPAGAMQRSRSTTRGRDTACTWRRSGSRPDWSRTATISRSSRPAAMASPRSGCRPAGTRCAPRGGRRRSTGSARTTPGRPSPCTARSRSRSTSRCAT
jgi:hypothetical protein